MFIMKKIPKLSTSEILQNKINKAYLTFILRVKAYILEKSAEWNVGELKATFEKAKADEDGKIKLITKWTMGDKVTKNTSQGYVEKNLNTIVIDNQFFSTMVGVQLIRSYPKN